MWASAATLLGSGHDHTAVAILSELLAGSELGTLDSFEKPASSQNAK
jgi:hypothetical protein